MSEDATYCVYCGEREERTEVTYGFDRLTGEAIHRVKFRCSNPKCWIGCGHSLGHKGVMYFLGLGPCGRCGGPPRLIY